MSNDFLTDQGMPHEPMTIRTKGSKALSNGSDQEESQGIQEPEAANEADGPDGAKSGESSGTGRRVPEKDAKRPERKIVDPVLGVLPPKKGSYKAARVGLTPDKFQMDPENLKNTIHMICQSKGGTGKTFVATTLASFFQRHVEALDMYCFDLDSNTKSFSSFPAFNAEQFSEAKLDSEGRVMIDPTAFDGAFNTALEDIEDDSVIIMDTGAGGSFWSVLQYIQSFDYPAMAANTGKNWRFMIHIVISGSSVDESKDTIKRIISLIDSPYVEYCVWGNEYFGDLSGIFDEIIEEFGEIFQRGVHLPRILDPRLDKALRTMREEGLSVTELFAKEGYSAIDRARINQYYYGNMGGKPGVFRALQNLDWAPSEREE